MALEVASRRDLYDGWIVQFGGIVRLGIFAPIGRESNGNVTAFFRKSRYTRLFWCERRKIAKYSGGYGSERLANSSALQWDSGFTWKSKSITRVSVCCCHHFPRLYRILRRNSREKMAPHGRWAADERSRRYCWSFFHSDSSRPLGPTIRQNMATTLGMSCVLTGPFCLS